MTSPNPNHAPDKRFNYLSSVELAECCFRKMKGCKVFPSCENLDSPVSK